MGWLSGPSVAAARRREAASLATAARLVTLIPEALALPSPAQKLQATEMALLDEIRDVGRWTIPTVLKELQMGRFHILVAPWNPQGNVLQCARGLVVTSQREAEAYCPGRSVRPVALRDVIVDLATAHGARLKFVHRVAESRLLREFGGLAAFSRW